jgi:histidinol phosphatase-like enzyme (inositol monophosphatase family)
MNNISSFLHQLCDAAADETLSRFRQKTEVTNKYTVGFDPVTEADKGAENVIRQMIEKAYPDHGIIGEETGNTQNDADYQWVIDPIDGTRSFISGLPTWGMLIGLYHKGNPCEGMFFQPFTSERYYTENGVSYCKLRDGKANPIKTSNVSSLDQATLMSTDPALFNSLELQQFDAVKSQCQLYRYGYDCYAYAMVAAGHIDLVIESGLHIYDIAALIPIIEQAGGLVTNWQGGSAAKGGQVIAAANKELHQAALETLNKA